MFENLIRQLLNDNALLRMHRFWVSSLKIRADKRSKFVLNIGLVMRNPRAKLLTTKICQANDTDAFLRLMTWLAELCSALPRFRKIRFFGSTECFPSQSMCSRWMQSWHLLGSNPAYAPRQGTLSTIVSLDPRVVNGKSGISYRDSTISSGILEKKFGSAQLLITRNCIALRMQTFLVSWKSSSKRSKFYKYHL